MSLTKEQELIIKETVTNEPGMYSIAACAGSGKSFTVFKAIEYILEQEPNASILYVVFNSANKDSAAAKLRQMGIIDYSAKAWTAHGYALYKFNSCIKKINEDDKQDYGRLNKDFIREITSTYKYTPEVLYSKHAPFHWLHDKYTSCSMGLKKFCEEMKLCFDDTYTGPTPAKEHTILTKNGKDRRVYGIPVNAVSYVSIDHIDAFKKIIELHEKRNFYTCSMYLKAVALSDRTGGNKYDYVFFDEAQDANYFMLKLLHKQDIGKFYFVGDIKQSIYNFNDTNVNVFETYTFDKEYTLSKSFRFGKEIADAANKITHIHGDKYLQIKGTEQTHETKPNSHALLYRTNAKMFSDGLKIAYNAKKRGLKLKINDLNGSVDMSAYNELLSFLKIYYKYEDKRAYYLNKTFFDAITLSPTAEAFENKLSSNPVLTFSDVFDEQWDALSDDIHSIINYAKDWHNFVDYYKAFIEAKCCTDPNKIITMTTMHRSKGMEWDIVDIMQPTRLYYTDRNGTVRRSPEAEQELNLAYVAVTRARKRLNASYLYEELIQEINGYGRGISIEDVKLEINTDKKQEKETVTV